MSLEELLSECRQQHMILLTNRRGQAALYAPNVKVSRQIRAAIRAYNHQLAQLIRAADARVCPSPRLHASYLWDVCFICERLNSAVKIVDAGRRQRAA